MMTHVDITPYIDRLREDLLAAAEGAGPDVTEAVKRLGFALAPATRLALMEAISHATAEITAEMPEGAVEVRLDGRDLAFVVDNPAALAEPIRTTVPPVDDDGSMARITLRLPESTKLQAEAAATAAEQSLNTWLVNVVRAATAADSDPTISAHRSRGQAGRGHRMTGWA